MTWTTSEKVMLLFAALACLTCVYLIGVAMIGIWTAGNDRVQSRLSGFYFPLGLTILCPFFLAFVVSLVICTVKR